MYKLLLIFLMTSLPVWAADSSEPEPWKWLNGLSEKEAARVLDISLNEIEKGTFEPTIKSLRNYECPEWFRDAKFGIWVCYAPQAVPAKTGWYGRNMYMKESLLEYHTKKFGHPSKFGFKDFIPDLTAEHFDADDLVSRFKEAGAKYFIALAVHHENFDLWDSKYHRWNAVQMGPKRDMIGLWREATLKHGLRWGVTTHLARSLSWYQVAHGEDEGGKYDGNNPEYWDLYHKPFKENHLSYPEDAPASWRLEFFLRLKDLIDNYKPDLLYFDGSVPFKPDGRPGLEVITHLYNSNAKWHDGVNEAVMNIKDRTSGIYDDEIATLDLEREQLLDIREAPWQNDTSIGPWFYTENARYKDPEPIIHMLVDIVSKNGNLLLNVPMRADGSIDDQAKALLKEIGKWMRVNGEALYGTRPWLVPGENSAVRRNRSHWGSALANAARTGDSNFQLRDGETRFTSKGDSTLYATVVGWPEEGEILLESMSGKANSKASVSRVKILGMQGELKSRLTPKGLAITLPAKKPLNNTWSLKITGSNLRDFNPPKPPPPPEPKPEPKPGTLVKPNEKGVLALDAAAATVHGSTPKLELKPDALKSNIGSWGNAKDYASWKFEVAKAGTYEARITYSCANGCGGSKFVLSTGDQHIAASSVVTGSWEDFKTVKIGSFIFRKAGLHTLTLKPQTPPNWKVIGLQSITLIPKQ